MPSYINPHNGQTIGYLETSGTTVEPFNVPMMWQASSLSYVSLTADASGNLQVTGGGGGGGGNAAAGLTGVAVPTSADYLGFNGAGGLLTGVSAANPLPCTFTGSAGNAAAGATGVPPPGYADNTGWTSGGNLVGVSLTNALPVQPGTGATFPVSGTVTTSPPVPIFWSSNAALGAGASINSQTFDTSTGQVFIEFSAYSITNLTAKFLESSDNVNFFSTDTYFVGANSGNYSTHKPAARYCYVQFTNTGSANPGGNGNLNLYASQSNNGNETDTQIADAYGNTIGSAAYNGTLWLQVALPSDMTTGSAVPSTANYIGFNNGGNLTGVSSAAPLPVSAVQSGSWTVAGTGTFTVSGSVSVSNFPATQTVSGTVTANQGTANATPWNENITQFGGSAVVTGPGVSGAGIPRVTVSSDSFPASQTISGTVSVSNFPATQNVAITSGLGTTSGTPLFVTGGSSGSANPTSFGGIAQPVYLDDNNVPLDDNGYQLVNTNWDGSDVATLSAQQQQLTALQAIQASEAAPRVTVGNVTPITGSAVPTNTVPVSGVILIQNQSNGLLDIMEEGDNTADNDLPGNQGIIGAEAYPRMFDGTYWQRQRGTLQNGLQVNDTATVNQLVPLLEAILLELRVVSASITQLGQPVQDGPDQLRNDYTLLN